MINQERIKNTLLDLVQIGSHSRNEKGVAEYLRKACEALGAQVETDDAGEKVGGNTGNLIARFPGTIKGAEPILFSSHMDTVVPGEGVRPVVEGDIVRSDGTTILGSDDKSGVAVILETIRAAKDANVAHTDIEVVFSICEEVGLLGAKHVDESRLRSRVGVVFDSDEPDVLFTRGPSSDAVEFKIYGLEAHAGVAPEEGISAIKIAAEAIAAMRLGRIDEETTANIGIIEGGKAVNVIPNLVTLKGEARSLDEAKLDAQTAHMIECVQAACARYEVTVDGKRTKARFEHALNRNYSAMNVSDDSRAVRIVVEAGKRLGREIKTMASGGGCDANVYNNKGIQCANIGTGMRAIHTVKEWIDVRDMVASAELGLEILKLHSEQAGR